MINVALLSRWHVHADDYAREVKANEQSFHPASMGRRC